MSSTDVLMADAGRNTIDATPLAKQSIVHEGKKYTTIKEGLAHILVPHDTPTTTDPKMSKEDAQKQQVFYNPIQQFNRDISVLAIKTFGMDNVQRKQQRHDQQMGKGNKGKKRQKAQGSGPADKKCATEAKKDEGATETKDKDTLAMEFDSQTLEKKDQDTTNSTKSESVSEAKARTAGGATETTKGSATEVDKSSGGNTNKPTMPDADIELSEASDDSTTKKRKLEGVVTEVSVAVKKQKATKNGDSVLKPAHTGPEATSDKAHSQAPWTPSFSILDALSATGLRALRYAKEIPFATAITSNDMSPKAVESIKMNVKHNKLESTIKPNTGNAIAYMYSYCDKKGYDVIDLDPYGTAAPFIDAAIQAVNEDGMLCVTCTDSAIFASHGYLEKTYSQYGGLPFKGESCHEGGLRLLLNAIATSAGRYGMAIEPLLSLSIDYYIRVFVRVRKAPLDVKLLAGKTMLVYSCDNGCGAWTRQYLARNKPIKNKNGDPFYKHGFASGPTADEHCRHCGTKTHIVGPMYGGPLHNVGFIDRILAQLSEADRETYPTMDRIEGMLRTAQEEVTFGVKGKDVHNGTTVLDPLIPKSDPAEIDHHPFFFTTSAVSKVLHCSAPPTAAIRGALRHAGFRVSMSHCKPGSIKTDASWEDIWHVMLDWIRQKAPLKNPLKERTAGHAIMAKATKPTETKKPVDAKKHSDAKQAADGKNKGVQKAEQAVGIETPASNKTPIETEKVSKSADTAKSIDAAESSAAEKRTEAEKSGDAPTAASSALEGGKKDLQMTGTEKPARPSYMGSDFEVKFDLNLGKDPDRGKLVRYQLAPRENWGPMARAK